MDNPETIQAIASSLKVVPEPDTINGKAISYVVDMAASLVLSAQNVHRNQERCHRLAIDAWNLVYVVVENNRQKKGKISERKYRDLVKILGDIQKFFSNEVATKYPPGQEASDFGTGMIGELRQKLQQCLQQFGFTSFTDVQQRVDGLAKISHSDLLPPSTSKSVDIGDRANFSQARGNAIGFNNTVINNINSQTDTTKQDEVLERLRWAPAQYSSFSGEGGCIPGTRTLVLDEVITWATSLNPDDPPIFWLYGPAGTGKSTIAYSVAERCRRFKGCLSASFFFTHTNSSCSDPNLFFSTIAYQLAKLDSNLKRSIVRGANKHANPENIRADIQLEDLIITPLSELGNQAPVVIVVDALDECNDAGGASEILRLLSSRMAPSPCLFKVFITSRPEPHIKATIHHDLGHVTRTFDISQDIDLSSTNNDIRFFLESRLREGVRNLLGSASPWPGVEEIDALVRQSGGLFIYASTAVKVILDKKFMDPRARLGKLLSMTQAPGLDAVNALYLRVLRSAIPEDADEILKVEFQLILGAIFVAGETLSPRVLEELLGLRPGAVRRILSGLHSVIAVPDNEDDGIHTFHMSFPRYLTDQQSFTGPDAKFFIDPSKYHAHVAKRCFEHMKTSLKGNICGFEDFSRIDTTTLSEEQSELISRRITGAVRYGCRHFAAHLYATATNICGLDEVLADWARHRLTYWLEVSVLLGSLGVVLPSLALLCKWLQKRIEATDCAKNMPRPNTGFFRRLLSSLHPRSQLNKQAPSVTAGRNILSLLGDAARMVSEFFDVVRHMPSHIYTSCIVFAPIQSLFSQTYSAQCSEIQFLHGNSLNWSAITVLHTINHQPLGVALSSNGRMLASSLEDGTIYLWNLDTGEHQVINGEAKDTINDSTTFPPVKFNAETKDLAKMFIAVTLNGLTLGDTKSTTFSPDDISGEAEYMTSKFIVFLLKSITPGDIKLIINNLKNVIDNLIAFALTFITRTNAEDMINEFTPLAFKVITSAEADDMINKFITFILEVIIREAEDTTNEPTTFSPDNIIGKAQDMINKFIVPLLNAITQKTEDTISESTSFLQDNISLSGKVEDLIKKFNAFMHNRITGEVQEAINEATIFSHDDIAAGVVFNEFMDFLRDRITTEAQSTTEESIAVSLEDITAEEITNKFVAYLRNHITTEDQDRINESIAFLLDGIPFETMISDFDTIIRNSIPREYQDTIIGAAAVIVEMVNKFIAFLLNSMGSDVDESVIKIITLLTNYSKGKAGGTIDNLISFSPDDKYIAAKHQIYDVASGHKILRYADCIAFSSDGRYMALSGEGGSIDLYDSQSHACLSHLSEHTGPLTSLIFSPDGKWIASASRDNALHIWNIEESRKATFLSRQEPMKHIHSLTFSPNAAYLAFCENDQVRIWVMEKGTELRPSRAWGRIGKSQKPMFSPDSKSITWLTDKQSITTVKIERVDKRTYLHKSRSYCSVAFSPSGKTILAGGCNAGGILLLRPGAQGEQARERVHIDGVVVGITSSPSSGYYASWTWGGGRGPICVWEVDEETSRATQIGVSWGNVRLAVFAPDGKSIAAISRDDSCYVGKLDALTGRPVVRWKLPRYTQSIEFSSDGQYLAISYDSHIELWLWDTGKRFRPSPRPHSGTIKGYAFSPDATYIALRYSWKKLYMVNLKQRARPIPLDNAEAITSSTLQFSHNGRHIAAIASGNCRVMVWEVMTGKLHSQIQSENLGEEFAFSPDGGYIAYQNPSGIHVWNFLGDGLVGKTVYWRSLSHLSFSPVNQKYIAALDDRIKSVSAILIDVETRAKVAETTEFSSYHGFMRDFRRRGRFPNIPSSSAQAIQEDNHNFPYTIDEEGWVKTAMSRPLCRLPKSYRPDNQELREGCIYDTNGNRIVIVSAAEKLVLIQFGTEPIYENHPPLRRGADMVGSIGRRFLSQTPAFLKMGQPN